MYENEQNSGFWEELRSSVRVLMFLPFAPELDRITGGELIRPYEINRVLQQMGVPLRTVVYGKSRDVFEQLEGSERPLAALWRRNAAASVLTEELQKARVEHRTLWLYLKTPPDMRLIAGRAFPAEPFYRLIDQLHAGGGKLWCNMHDLAPDHAEGICRRGLGNGHFGKRHARALLRYGHRQAYLQEKLLAKADLVTVVSEGMRRQIVERYPRVSQRITLLNAGIQPAMFTDPPASKPVSQKHWTLGYLGSGNDLVFGAIEQEWQKIRGLSIDLLLAGRDTEQIAVQFSSLPVHAEEQRNYKDFSRIAAKVDMWLVSHGNDTYFDLAWPLKMPMYLASGRPMLVSHSTELDYHPESRFFHIWQQGELSELLADITANMDGARIQAAEGARWVLDNATWEQQLAKALQPMLASI